MTWEPELEELRRREAFAEELGGPDKVERQHHFGKMTIRERIAAVADDESFHEIGKTAGVAEYDDDGNLVHLTPSNFLFGVARIDERPVILSGDDFTVRGGSADATIPAKRSTAEKMAAELRLPHVRLVDGMGGGGSVKNHRDCWPYLHPRSSRLGHDRRPSRDRPIGGAGVGFGCWDRRSPCGNVALLGHRA